MDDTMPYAQERCVTSVTSVNLSTTTQAAIELILSEAIEYDFVHFRDQLIEAWVSRLSLPSSSPYRLSAERAIIVADHHGGLPTLLGPACLTLVMETPMVSLTSTTGAAVSTFGVSIQLDYRQRVRLTLGYCSIESHWVHLRGSPHKSVNCSPRCVTRWHHKWADVNQIYRGSGNVLQRVVALMIELLKEGPQDLRHIMTSECWDAAVCELRETIGDLQIGGPFVRV